MVEARSEVPLCDVTVWEKLLYGPRSKRLTRFLALTEAAEPVIVLNQFYELMRFPRTS